MIEFHHSSETPSNAIDFSPSRLSALKVSTHPPDTVMQSATCSLNLFRSLWS